ncbi:MAG: hypothetical protein WCP71_04730 [Actinomycetes bacterium]
MVVHFLNHLAMSTQEPGSDPGSGLKLYQSFLLYIVAPVGLFLGITALVLLTSRPKKN